MTKEKSITGGQQWRDIETAPKDGTPIDMWVLREHEHGEVYEVRRCNVHWGKIADNFTGEVYEGWIGLKDLYAKITPLKWMPLPQPPKGSME